MMEVSSDEDSTQDDPQPKKIIIVRSRRDARRSLRMHLLSNRPSLFQQVNNCQGQSKSDSVDCPSPVETRPHKTPDSESDDADLDEPIGVTKNKVTSESDDDDAELDEPFGVTKKKVTPEYDEYEAILDDIFGVTKKKVTPESDDDDADLDEPIEVSKKKVTPESDDDDADLDEPIEVTKKKVTPESDDDDADLDEPIEVTKKKVTPESDDDDADLDEPIEVTKKKVTPESDDDDADLDEPFGVTKKKVTPKAKYDEYEAILDDIFGVTKKKVTPGPDEVEADTEDDDAAVTENEIETGKETEPESEPPPREQPAPPHHLEVITFVRTTRSKAVTSTCSSGLPVRESEIDLELEQSEQGTKTETENGSVHDTVLTESLANFAIQSLRSKSDMEVKSHEDNEDAVIPEDLDTEAQTLEGPPIIDVYNNYDDADPPSSPSPSVSSLSSLPPKLEVEMEFEAAEAEHGERVPEHDHVDDVEPAEEFLQTLKTPSTKVKVPYGLYKNPCVYCGNMFSNTSSLIDHMSTHTGERSYFCKHCPRSFRSASVLFNHEKTHSTEKSYACSMCDARFTIPGNRWAHERTIHGKSRFARVKGQAQTLRHRFRPRNKTVSNSKKSKTKPTKFTQKRSEVTPPPPAPAPPELGPLLEGLNLPGMRRVTSVKLSRIHPMAILEHTVLKQKPTDTIAEVKGQAEAVKMTCPFCSKTYPSFLSIKKHVLRYHARDEERPFRCPTCGKGFFYQNEVTHHVKDIHTGRMPICPHEGCNRKFENSWSLKLHLARIHMQKGLRPLKCHFCSKRFIRGCERNLHVKVSHPGRYLAGNAPPSSRKGVQEVLTPDILMDVEVKGHQEQVLVKPKRGRGRPRKIKPEPEANKVKIEEPQPGPSNMDIDMNSIDEGGDVDLGVAMETNNVKDNLNFKCSDCDLSFASRRRLNLHVVVEHSKNKSGESQGQHQIMEADGEPMTPISVPMAFASTSTSEATLTTVTVTQTKSGRCIQPPARFSPPVLKTETDVTPTPEPQPMPSSSGQSQVQGQVQVKRGRGRPRKRPRVSVEVEVDLNGGDVNKSDRNGGDVNRGDLNGGDVNLGDLNLGDPNPINLTPSKPEKVSVSWNGFKGQLSCLFCGFKPKSALFLIDHVNSHIGERWYKCRYCPKDFVYFSSFKSHEDSHLGRTHPCSICGRLFFHASNRWAHEKTHSTDRILKCPYCSKQFVTKAQEYQHKRNMHFMLFKRDQLLKMRNKVNLIGRKRSEVIPPKPRVAATNVVPRVTGEGEIQVKVKRGRGRPRKMTNLEREAQFGVDGVAGVINGMEVPQVAAEVEVVAAGADEQEVRAPQLWERFAEDMNFSGGGIMANVSAGSSAWSRLSFEGAVGSQGGDVSSSNLELASIRGGCGGKDRDGTTEVNGVSGFLTDEDRQFLFNMNTLRRNKTGPEVAGGSNGAENGDGNHENESQVGNGIGEVEVGESSVVADEGGDGAGGGVAGDGDVDQDDGEGGTVAGGGDHDYECNIETSIVPPPPASPPPAPDGGESASEGTEFSSVLL